MKSKPSRIKTVDLRKAKPAQIFNIIRALMDLKPEKFKVKIRKVD
jgi:hypothetical protein